MKRLIFATGKWSTLLTLGFLQERSNYKEENNVLLHISHWADSDYLTSFQNFASRLGCFSQVSCINNCVYTHADADNFIEGRMEEFPNEVAAELLKDKVPGLDGFDEIIVPHLFSNKSRMLLAMFPSSRAYCIEEGLNSYFRHYQTRVLKKEQSYFLSRLSGYVSYNFKGLAPLFDVEAHGVPLVVPTGTGLRNVLGDVDVSAVPSVAPSDASRALFVGQIPSGSISAKDLLDQYVSSISALLQEGVVVDFVPHPRDQTAITASLLDVFQIEAFNVLRSPEAPVERVAQLGFWDLVVSYSSSALVTIPALTNVPTFTIEEYDRASLRPGTGDFENGRNFCAVVTPGLRSFIQACSKDEVSPKKVARNVYASFVPKPELIKEIYRRRPMKMTLRELRRLPARELMQKIEAKPYEPIYRLAYAHSAPSYLSAVSAAWAGLLMNPKRRNSYREFAAVSLKPIWRYVRPVVPKSKPELAKIAQDRPLSVSALMGTAALAEAAGNWKEAVRLRIVMILAHPFNPASYIGLRKTLKRRDWARATSSQSSAASVQALLSEMGRLKREAEEIPAAGRDIAALTYRPNRGATGGPGGVLSLQKSILGPWFEDRAIYYLFRTNQTYRDVYADLVSGADFALDACRTGKYGYYFAHDLGAAYGLALAKKPYIMDWHFQGAFVTQMLNFGHKFSEDYIRALKEMERIAFESAKYVVFPSDGARDMYFSDPHRGCASESLANLGPSLYNTILPDPVAAKPSLNSKLADFDGLTFTSVGTLTTAKGQDQVLDFFERVLPWMGRKVRWVCIGDGPMREEVLVRANSLSRTNPDFTFLYYPKVPHSDVMHILEQSDLYIMLHRISIFDFATLEAMSKGCAVVLSKVGGNVDFGRDGAVLFSEDILEGDGSLWRPAAIAEAKVRSRKALDTHFSALQFRTNNHRLLRMLTDLEANQKSQTPHAHDEAEYRKIA